MGTYGAEWSAVGYAGCGNVASLIDSLAGRTAVVCGNATGVFEEYQWCVDRVRDPVVFGVNDVGMYLPKLDHWISLHSDNLDAWKAVRRLHHRTDEVAKLHSEMAKPSVDYVWERLTPMFALSGYYAMQVAYIMGAKLIILCGCPGLPWRRFFDVEERKDFGYGGGAGTGDEGVRQQIIHEMNRLPEFRRKVRSLSGWTKEFFGRPIIGRDVLLKEEVNGCIR